MEREPAPCADGFRSRYQRINKWSVGGGAVACCCSVFTVVSDSGRESRGLGASEATVRSRAAAPLCCQPRQ